jgi:hypothetical protein
LPLLRRLAYALPHSTIAQADIAITAQGAFLRSSAGVEGIPLGTFFVEIHPRLYIPAGYEATPAVAPEVLARAIGASESQVVFVGTDARPLAIEESAFVSLEAELVEAPPWEPLAGEAIANALREEAIELKVTSLGVMPLRGVEPPPSEG